MTDSIKSTLTHYQWLMDSLLHAGEAIMSIYAQDRQIWNIREKADQSPVTLADDACHLILKAAIDEHSNLPLLSEEGGEVGYEQRKEWSSYWLLDPLDGTKEFVDGTGEFCICLALMKHNEPQLGFIYIPKTKEMFFGGQTIGSARLVGDDLEVLSQNTKRADPWRVIASRRSKWHGPWSDRVGHFSQHQCGSAIKFCRLAQGEVDLYPRLGETCEWDTAAGQALLEGVGGKVMTIEGKPLQYNKPVLINPEFYAISFDGCGQELLD